MSQLERPSLLPAQLYPMWTTNSCHSVPKHCRHDHSTNATSINIYTLLYKTFKYILCLSLLIFRYSENDKKTI